MPSFQHHVWPTPFDLVVTIAFLALLIGIPALGYFFMVLDFRAILRRLRRGLIRVGYYLYDTPEWARAETPRSIKVLGLRLPCTEEDLKRAYRKRVKQLHPDHGGDERRFLLLQAQFEEAASDRRQPSARPAALRPRRKRRQSCRSSRRGRFHSWWATSVCSVCGTDVVNHPFDVDDFLFVRRNRDRHFGFGDENLPYPANDWGSLLRKREKADVAFDDEHAAVIAHACKFTGHDRRSSAASTSAIYRW